MSYLDVKKTVESLYGKNVLCEINKGRNKIVRLSIKISQIYSSMFTIEPLESIELDRKSFSYGDVMCGDIKFL